MRFIGSVPHQTGKAQRETRSFISVEKLEASWQLNDSEYVGFGGTGKAISGRYEGFGRWLSRGEPIWRPTVCLDQDGEISFADGRDRFAWLRDHGLKVLPVQVPPEKALLIEARFGTTSPNVQLAADGPASRALTSLLPPRLTLPLFRPFVAIPPSRRFMHVIIRFIERDFGFCSNQPAQWCRTSWACFYKLPDCLSCRSR